jgi:hypothetical protein
MAFKLRKKSRHPMPESTSDEFASSDEFVLSMDTGVGFVNPDWNPEWIYPGKKESSDHGKSSDDG